MFGKIVPDYKGQHQKSLKPSPEIPPKGITCLDRTRKDSLKRLQKPKYRVKVTPHECLDASFKA